jgi:predicted ribosomally synthesized peptide with SipW-like signal peptide
MKKNTTKRALVASILMLCLCFSALIGTTFAWFTDSVTSSGNVIQTGKFDVGMYWAEGTADPADKTAWKDASRGAIFNNEYWEPGYSEAKHLKIVNEGTLALKYELAIIPHGEFSKLAEVIEVYYVVGATEMTTRNDLDAHYIGTLNDLVNNGIESGSLLKGESYDATIVLKMKEEAGNEYQNLSIGTEFSIQLVATQLTSEKDSFDNQYDANAFEVVNDIAQLQAAINNAEDTKTIFIKSGNYTLNSMIVVEGKSVTLVGLGSVNIKMASNQHMFTIQDSKNPNSEMNVTIKNINLDGNNVSKNGFNVKYNVTLNLENVNVKNTTWADVLLDNANDYADDKFYDGTKTVVNLKNSNVEDVSMDTLPVVDTHVYAGAGVTTYAEFNYDKDSTVGVVEKQTISKNYATMFINGCNTDTEHYVFTAANDEQLTNVLATVQGNSKYWNTPVVVKLAAGEYDGDYVVNQYPEWNGERGHGNQNNPYNGGVAGAPVLNLTVKGEVAQTYGRAATAVPAAIFTGTFTVNGFGNSMTGFSTTKENPAPITFKTVAFQGNYDGSETFVGNSIVFKALNAVDNLYFDGCYFVDATHVTLGSTTPDNSDIIIDDNLYKIFICDEDGNGLSNIFVQYCTEEQCKIDYTDANGYIVVPSNEYHVALIVDEAGVYQGATYDASNYPVFEGDSKVITVTLTK